MEKINPPRYAGDGISCDQAMFSMQRASGIHDVDQLWWWACAFKYIWRFWDKGGARDLDCAEDCIERLKECRYGTGATPATSTASSALRSAGMELIQTSPSIEALVEEAKSWINLGEEYVSLSVNRFAALAYGAAADYDELCDELETKR